MLEVIPTGEPAAWLKKQALLVGDKPVVAAVVLFADEPQAVLPNDAESKFTATKLPMLKERERVWILIQFRSKGALMTRFTMPFVKQQKSLNQSE